jgi:hypothetical protein
MVAFVTKKLNLHHMAHPIDNHNGDTTVGPVSWILGMVFFAFSAMEVREIFQTISAILATMSFSIGIVLTLYKNRADVYDMFYTITKKKDADVEKTKKYLKYRYLFLLIAVACLAAFFFFFL